jgi:hypothetical protein
MNIDISLIDNDLLEVLNKKIVISRRVDDIYQTNDKEFMDCNNEVMCCIDVNNSFSDLY